MHQQGVCISQIMISSLLVLANLFVSPCWAARAVEKKSLTLDEAKSLSLKSETEFRIEVNEIVLKQLNRHLATRGSRGFMRDCLKRMEEYRDLIEAQLKKNKVPVEFLALPIVESGYRNLPASQSSGFSTWKSAGLWQLTVATARNFGLEVNDKTDERLDIEKQTGAAMRLLTTHNARFNDWRLTLMAYNMGEGALQKGIKRVGSKDPWVLIEAGVQGDRDYLGKVMAAMIIMKNPDLVK